MREVSPGDQIFSFRDRKIGAIGVATSNCYEAPKPDEFGTAGQKWEQVGWRVDVVYTKMDQPITPKDDIDHIRPLLPDKYSPLQQNGDGLQSVYLAAISGELADLLKQRLDLAGNEIAVASVGPSNEQADLVQSGVESHLEVEIRQSTTLDETVKDQLVKSRRGQGRFRHNVRQIESHCRLTGISDSRFLIASHIKPWRSSTNQERLDGENGFLLTPNIDALFDRGFISFEDEGHLLVSPVADRQVLHLLGVPVDRTVNVGQFTQGQKKYLAYHRREVFLEAGRES